MSLRCGIGIPILLLALAGCGGGGQKLIKDASLVEMAAPVARAFDDRIEVAIDAVIVRNGAGAWATDADWDEYLVSVRSLLGEPLQVKELAVFDALGTRRPALADRDALIEASRDVEARYGQSGQLVKTKGYGWQIAAGGAVAGLGVATAVGIAYTGAAVMGGAATAGATGAAMIFPPVLVIVGGVMMGSGIVRSMNNASVAEELQRRRTPLPITIGAREARRLDLFFPLTPLPRGLEVVYADAQGDHVVHADTSAALAAAHMPVQPEKPGPDMDALIHEESPRFPKDAVRAGIDSGVVTARLVVDAAGHPRRVELVEVSHPGVFDEEAIRVLWRYRYAMSHKPERIVDARVEFAR